MDAKYVIEMLDEIIACLEDAQSRNKNLDVAALHISQILKRELESVLEGDNHMSTRIPCSPEPWERTAGHEVASGRGYDRAIIARMAKKKDGVDLPVEANARLMAAAPKLLKAMKEMLPFIEEDDLGEYNSAPFVEALKKYKTAITEAEGEQP